MSKWISWAGGERPVCADTIVEIQCIDGVKEKGRADSFCWTCSEDESDIRQYRLCGGVPIHDPVNKPSHYMLFPEQGIEFIDVRDVLIERLKDFSPKQIDYWSRAFEYLARAGGKNGVEDIKKAKWYLDRLVATLEEQK